MPMLFAHHEMLDSLDVFHLHPTTPAGHILALAFYSLLILGAARASWIVWSRCRSALADRRGQGGLGTPGLAERRP